MKSQRAQRVHPPELSVEEQRLQLLSAELAEVISTEHQVIGEDAEHQLTAVYLHRGSSAEVFAPDRAMTQMLFFGMRRLSPLMLSTWLPVIAMSGGGKIRFMQQILSCWKPIFLFLCIALS